MNNYQWINTERKPLEHACMLDLDGTRLFLGRIYRTEKPLIPNGATYGWSYNGKLYMSEAEAKAAVIRRVEGGGA
jgi:hypothetical protein